MEVFFYNGVFVEPGDPVVSLEDRGHQFGDGVYEVVRAYGGKLFLLEEHLARLQRSAAAIEMPLPYAIEELRLILQQALARSQLSDALVYFQVTRGSSPRQHAFPSKNSSPNFMLSVRPAKTYSEAEREKGIRIAVMEDERWSNCFIKSINLLPNILAKEKALRLGADEAVFHRNGRLTEGSSSNIFLVKKATLITPQANRWILGGISRLAVLRIAKEAGVTIEERDVELSELTGADEVFMTSTSYEVMPVNQVQDHHYKRNKNGLTFRLAQSFKILSSL